ncbi:MAG TPA: hypothetical protein VG889_18910 [Rhizomicrobium sp.]|nr:hypothetical protein [Rhizomicrobium sp.]
MTAIYRLRAGVLICLALGGVATASAEERDMLATVKYCVAKESCKPRGGATINIDATQNPIAGAKMSCPGPTNPDGEIQCRLVCDSAFGLRGQIGLVPVDHRPGNQYFPAPPQLNIKITGCNASPPGPYIVVLNYKDYDGTTKLEEERTNIYSRTLGYSDREIIASRDDSTAGVKLLMAHWNGSEDQKNAVRRLVEINKDLSALYLDAGAATDDASYARAAAVNSKLSVAALDLVQKDTIAKIESRPLRFANGGGLAVTMAQLHDTQNAFHDTLVRGAASGDETAATALKRGDVYWTAERLNSRSIRAALAADRTLQDGGS